MKKYEKDFLTASLP